VLEITSVLPGGALQGPFRVPARLEALEGAAGAGGFFSYAAGTAAELARRHPVEGLRLHLESDLPARRGLSSSAAVCVLVARAYSRLYGLGLSPRDEMELAYAGERRAGSACGRMDQICAFGRRLSLLSFDGEALEVEPLASGARIHLLIVDLRRDKDTRRILADLNACFPDAPGPIAKGVREALGPRNREALARAREVLAAGDARALGELMGEVQDRFFELVTPASAALSAPRLREVLAHPAVGELAFGGKGVGSQGDGCAQLVARGAEERVALAERLGRELGVGCLPLTLEPGHAVG
jgi:mevalonate kinase